MATNKLDPTPGSEPKPKKEIPSYVRKDVAKRKAKEAPADKFTKDSDTPVTIEEYHALMEDRPVKLGPKTSGFVRGGGKDGKSCLQCSHWYTSPTSAHSTCELVRVSDLEDNIQADDYCILWTKDGISVPGLESKREEKTGTIP